MSKAAQAEINGLLDEAEKRGAFLSTADPRIRRHLERLTKTGRLCSPLPSVYARPAYARGLSKAATTLHKMRALANIHPSWAFCHGSAALVYGLSVPNRHLEMLHLATKADGSTRGTGALSRHRMQERFLTTVDGLRVTTFERTVCDCLRYFDFESALVVADSALRVSGMSKDELITMIRHNAKGFPGVRHALEVASMATALAESGGESITRARLHMLGYEAPMLQYAIPDPLNPRHVYRGDFAWRIGDGTLVLGELDGREKYRLKRPDGQSDPIAALSDERLRESHINALRIPVMRFSYAQMINKDYFCRLLDAFHIRRQCAERPVSQGLTELYSRTRTNVARRSRRPRQTYMLDGYHIQASVERNYLRLTG